MRKDLHTYRNFEESLKEKRLVWQTLGAAPAEDPDAAKLSKEKIAKKSVDEREAMRDEFREKDFQQMIELFGMDTFKEGNPFEKADEKPKLDPAVTSSLSDFEGVTAEDWDYTTPEGAASIRKDLIMSGMKANDTDDTDFFDDMFNQLAKSYDTEYLQKKAEEQSAKFSDINQWYKDPNKYARQLMVFDPEFVKAWTHYESIKNMIQARATAKKAAKEALTDEQTVLPTIDKLSKQTTTMIKDLYRGLREKDPVSICLAAGAVAAVVGASILWKKTKWFRPTLLIGGATIFAGEAMARWYGFDVFKKLGLKDDHEEIKGKAIEPILRIVPEAKNLDAYVILAASQMSVEDLYDEYKKVAAVGGTSIDPKLFPLQFPRYSGKSPLRLKSADDAEYEKNGHDLFLFMKYFIQAQQKVHADDPNAPDFETLIKTDYVLKNSLIIDLAADMLDKEAPQDQKSVFDTAMNLMNKSSKGVLHRQLQAGGFTENEYQLAGEDGWFGKVWGTRKLARAAREAGDRITPDIEPTIGIKILGLPMVVREDKTLGRFFIFDANSFAEADTSNNKAIAEIPFEGSEGVTQMEGKTLKNHMIEKTKKFLEPALQETNKQLIGIATLDLSRLEYGNDGRWRLTYELNGDTTEREAEVEVEAPFRVKSVVDSNLDFDLLEYRDLLDGYEKERIANEIELQKAINKMITDLNASAPADKKFGNLKIETLPASELRKWQLTKFVIPFLDGKISYDKQGAYKSQFLSILKWGAYKKLIGKMEPKGDLYEALKSIQDYHDNKALFDRMKDETIYVGSQRILQVGEFLPKGTKTEGVINGKPIIDYNESPDEIVTDLKTYFGEIGNQ